MATKRQVAPGWNMSTADTIPPVPLRTKIARPLSRSKPATASPGRTEWWRDIGWSEP